MGHRKSSSKGEFISCLRQKSRLSQRSDLLLYIKGIEQIKKKSKPKSSINK